MTGQAAVEYLITYAWVFALIAIIVGILYSLVGIREIHIQEACTAAPGWWCDAVRFSIRDEPLAGARILKINGSISNGLGFGVRVAEMNVTLVAPLQGEYTLRPGLSGAYISPEAVPPGGELTLYLGIPHDTPIPPGTMFRIRFALAYSSDVTGTALRTAGTLYKRST